ncbi:MAG: extracellular solute-binding protein [Clostridia bacterium]|nr:extracellular solute-binding protein [Clostridia bacterium]
MKMSKILSLVLAVMMLVTCLVACTPKTPDPQPDPNADLKGTYDITMWVSEKEGVADLFQQQIDAFEAANPGIIINATINGVSEADAGSQVVNDVASAPDIYCFAQDQLARLVQAGALAPLGLKAAETIKTNNDAGSVSGATVAGTLYAYPMTSDNGYFMYYDTSIINETDADSLEAIIAACEKAGKKVRFALENAWYTASFFFATGCQSNWTMDAEGKFNAVDDNYNSANGLIAMKGMQMLAQSPAYDSNADIFTDAGVVVTGIWNAQAAADHFGANLGATDLPSFTVDGKSYHLGSFTGYKLMGVKPQNDTKKAAVLSQLAQYLTNEECQLARYNSFEWGPSNKNAQASEAVQANLSLAAFAKQGEFGVPQGQIHGSWWDIAKVLGAEAKNAKSDADLQTALNTYKTAIDGLLTMTDEQKQAWSVIGSICGSNWDTDFPMTKQDDGTYLSAALELNAEESLKVRQGASWDVSYGASEGQYATDDGNLKVETTGTYYVKLTLSDNGGYVELIPVE